MEEIEIISPEGVRGYVPKSQVQLALVNGYSVPPDQMVMVTSPDGARGEIPKFQLEEAIQAGYQPYGDSNLALAGKSFLKGLGSLADLPKAAAEGLQGLINQSGGLADSASLLRASLGGRDALSGAPRLDVAKYVPSTEDARRGIKEYTGIDLEPQPTTGGQRILSNAAEFAGGVTPFGLAAKAPSIGTNIFNAFKNAAGGAGLGATSGVLQEAGVNPLVADIGATVAIPTISAAKGNLLNKFSNSHKNLKTEAKVRDALKGQIGEENIPKALENIKKYQKTKKPIKLDLTTAEIAEDPGLSKLYRSQSNLKNLPQVHEANQEKLLEALNKIGTTGLEDSARGDLLRNPFIERLAKKKEKRSRVTEPHFKELENIQEGITTENARKLLQQEIEVASPNVRAPLEKYVTNLNRNNVSPQVTAKIKDLNNQLKTIHKEYAEFNPIILKGITNPIKQEIAVLENQLLPRPIQIENTIQELGDKVNAASRAGESNIARRYGGIKKAYEKDLSKIPQGLKHRTEYARHSIDINDIENSPLLGAFVKENKDVNKLNGLIMPSEKIPDAVLRADLPNTKLLINKSKSDPQLLNVIKGTYIDELIKKSTLASGNLSYNGANKFLNKTMKEKIDVVFNSKEKKVLNQYLDSLEKKSKLQTRGNIDSNSNTAQKLQVASEFNNSLGSLGKLAEKGALKGAGLGKVGEIALEGVKGAFNAIKNGRYDNVLERALIDPNYFKKIMTKELNPKTFTDFYKPTSGALPYILSKQRGGE